MCSSKHMRDAKHLQRQWPLFAHECPSHCHSIYQCQPLPDQSASQLCSLHSALDKMHYVARSQWWILLQNLHSAAMQHRISSGLLARGSEGRLDGVVCYNKVQEWVLLD